MKKDNSIKKDIGIALLTVLGFYVTLIVAGWIDTKLGLAQAYTLVDIASLTVKVATASALAWVVKRIVFTKTIGKDFGKVFDEGWDKLDIKEKTRWIIGIFIAIFTAILYASK